MGCTHVIGFGRTRSEGEIYFRQRQLIGGRIDFKEGQIIGYTYLKTRLV